MASANRTLAGRRRRASKSAVWFTRKENGRTVHNWPSNFFIEPDGSHVEGEFQAAKHEGHPWRQNILLSVSPGMSKRLGRQWKLTPAELKDWDRRKIGVMRELIWNKVCDWQEIEDSLVDTGDGDLVETNWWHDNYWGDCSCMRCHKIGENWLGQIWMDTRERVAEDS